MYRLRYLPEEVSLWRDQYHQLAHQLGDSGHPSLLRQQLQVTQTSHAQTGSGAWSCGNQRYRKEHGFEDPEREIETKLGKI